MRQSFLGAWHRGAALAAGVFALASSHAFTVGFVAPRSGPLAAVGQEQVDGFQLALDELGGRLGGQATRVIVEDDQVKPELGVQAVRKLIDGDRADVIVGLSLSNVLMATVPRLAEAGIPAIATDAGPSLLAGAQCRRNIFSVAWQNDGAAEAMGQYMKDQGIKRVFVMAPNYQAGKDMVAGFKRTFKGTVAEELYTQVNQPDYAAEIAQLSAVKPDALFVFYPGSMGINFVKQLKQAGSSVPVYSVFTIDGTTLPALKDSATGIFSGAMWDAALVNAESRRFVAAFEAKFKRTPSQFAATAYDAAKLLDHAIRRIPGKEGDKEALTNAIKESGAEFKSVRGSFRFNRNNLPVQDYYVFKTEKEGGRVRMRQVAVPLQGQGDAYVAQCPLK